jgi:ATP-binding cassette subfamily B protein
MLSFTRSDEWRFFGALFRSNRRLTALWWFLLAARGILPAILTVAIGSLVSAVQGGRSLGPTLVVAVVTYIVLQAITPLHASLGEIVGDRLSSWLNDQLLGSATRPGGIAHLERSDLADDLVTARDFDLGISGPPLSITMGFIASGLVEIVFGLAQAAVLLRYRWWAPLLLLAAWGSTHVLLRESSVWRDRNTDEVQEAQRHADYAYRLAVDPPAAKELRLFGLAGWAVTRFAGHRRRLVDLRFEATKLRQRPMRWAVLILLVANGLVFWSLASDAASGRLDLGALVIYAQAALGVSAIAFGGLGWALSIAAQTVAAVGRLDGAMAEAGSLVDGQGDAAHMPAREIRFRGVGFAYPGEGRPVLDGFDLTIRAGETLAIVGVNGAGKTTLTKLLCRLYDPTAGAVEVDGVDLRTLGVQSWRRQVTAVFQDFVRWELPLRDNVAPLGAPDADILASLEAAGAAGLAGLDTPLAKGYAGGTDLSGGQWQRIALARAVCAVRQGARLVVLDEPTAQLDVRGEAEIFDRVIHATRDVTTILISHRFSTVRHADRICVLEHGEVVELGTHAELMQLGGRYRTMFDLQASRFNDDADESEIALDDAGSVSAGEGVSGAAP